MLVVTKGSSHDTDAGRRNSNVIAQVYKMAANFVNQIPQNQL